MKVKIKLIIIAAILLVVTVAAFGLFMNFQLSGVEKSKFESYLTDMSVNGAQTLETYLDSVKVRYDTITALPSIQEFTGGKYNSATDAESSSTYAAAYEALDSLVKSGTLLSAVIYDNNDSYLLKCGVSDKITSANGICNVNAPDGEPMFFTAEKSTTCGLSVKTKVNNYNVGLVFYQYDSNNASKEGRGAANIIGQSGSFLFIVDPDGNIMANSQTSGQNIDSADETIINSGYKQYVDSAVKEPSAAFLVGDETAVVTATGNKWKVIANAKTAKSRVFSSNASGAIAGIGVAMVIICLVAAIILIITVTKPLYKIQETLLKISRGDHEARVDIMSRNEYGDIARVFNDIVDNIIVSESRYRTIIDMSDNIIFEWNLTTKEVVFSNNFNKKFSYRAPSEHFADSFLIKCKVHPEDADRYTADLQKLERGENFKHNEYRIKNIYGDYIWVLMRTSSILDAEGKTVKIVGVIVDIDRAKKSENILTARASFDSLTNVFNRETIEVAINNEIELIAARKTEFAILFVDIDDFKFYNDQYSHATGDQVLRFTATTIKNAVGDKGMVGRYGGDEFIVCIKEADTNDPASVAEQILKTLKDGFDSDSGDHLTVNVSIGISVIKDNTKRVEEIIGQADDAMYRIKKSGKSNFGFLET